jgi:hypothetical protein
MSLEKNYSVLVNEHNVRHGIRRAFNGHMETAVSELLQNSQRAGAKNVRAGISGTEEEISTIKEHGSKGSVIIWYEDDGHGLQNGIDSMHDLLSMGDTGFEREEALQQDPMGLGINSILSLEGVEWVRISSRGMVLTIDTSRWWNDREYYTTWISRIESFEDKGSGFRIEARVHNGKANDFGGSFKLKWPNHYHEGPLVDRSSTIPVSGYEGWFDSVLFENYPADIGLPRIYNPSEVRVDTEYMGKNRLRVWAKGAIDDTCYWRQGVVNWYGQIIKVDHNGEILNRMKGLSFSLDVRDGAPLNVTSPVRDSIIDDSKIEELVSFCVDSFFKAMSETTEVPKFKEVLVAHDISKARAISEVPWVALMPAHASEVDNSASSFDEDIPNKTIVLPRKGAGIEYTLLNTDVALINGNPEEPFIGRLSKSMLYSLSLQTPTYIVNADKNEQGMGDMVNIVQFRVPQEKPDFEYGLLNMWTGGEWRIVTSEEMNDRSFDNCEWKTLEAPVAILREGISSMGDDATVMMLAARQPLDKVVRELADFISNQPDDWYRGWYRDYNDSIQSVVRAIMGTDVIKKQFDFSDLTTFLKERNNGEWKINECVENIKYLYEAPAVVPYAIEVTGSQGTIRKLRLH